MAFIDELRDTQTKNRECAEKYIECIHWECERKKSVHRISGYPTLDCEFYPGSFVPELEGHTGTPQQRAAFHRKVNLDRSLPDYRLYTQLGVYHTGDGYPCPQHLVLKSASDAQQVKAMVEQQLREDGFTRFTIKVMPYYATENVYDIGHFKRTRTEVETGNVFYCLHVTVEW